MQFEQLGLERGNSDRPSVATSPRGNDCRQAPCDLTLTVRSYRDHTNSPY